jgi:hypothetical protein
MQLLEHRVSRTLVALGLLASVATATAEPNLVVRSLERPLVAGTCDSLELSEDLAIVVENVGDEAVTQPFEVLVFEDVDGDERPSAGVDTMLGVVAVGPPLGAGEGRTLSVAVSGALEYRDALLHAWADSGREIVEADESDNGGRSAGECRRTPPAASFDPVLEWEWTEANVDQTPMVGDVNADGTPDVVFVSESLWLIVLDGRTGEEIWRTQGARDLAEWAQLALAELDGDPGLEIVALARGARFLVAFDDDGSPWWLSDEFTDSHRGGFGGVAIADLDCDGRAEAIFGREVFDAATGARLWTPEFGGTQGTNERYPGFATTADLDGDGDLEVIAGPTAYTWNQGTATGDILWRAPGIPEGYTATGQFDDDPAPEVVVVHLGRLWLVEGDTGAVVWEVEFPLGGGGCMPLIIRCGPPTVADFDGDGQAEIGVAGADWFAVFERDGSVLWQTPIEDCSSSFTSATVFDFEDDGAAEVVYQDEWTLRVLRGTDGAVLASIPSSSLTWNEMVTIADVDGDNRAEIIAPVNDAGGGSFRGIRVFGDRADNWVNTRRIWSQHSYHVDNVLDDGRVPPADSGSCQEDSWLTHGTYRSQRFGRAEDDALALPDLALTVLDAVLDPSLPCTPAQVVEGRIGNGGAVGTAPGIQLVAYLGDPASGGRRVVSASVPALEPGEWWPFSLSVPVLESGEVVLIVDDDGTGSGTGSLTECREDNNDCSVGVEIELPPGPEPVGPVLFATGHGGPNAAVVSGDFDWSADEGNPRPPGDHYHLVRATRPDLLAPVPGTSPWLLTSWDDRTPRSAQVPTCHFLRVVAVNACEEEEPTP